MKTDLDETDWHILEELQNDGRVTNVELARRVGISAPACLRRVRVMEDAKIIGGYRALLNPRLLGFELIAFALVGLKSQAEQDLQAFRDQVEAWPIVREAYMLSGLTDFILKCVVSDLTAFKEFVINDLTAAPNVAEVRTALSLGTSKDKGLVPILKQSPANTENK